MRLFEGQIIDCHYHPAFDAETDWSWFQPVGGIQEQIDALRRTGITQACGAAIGRRHPSSFDEIRTLNDQVLALRDRFPDFYIPGVQVHPHFPDESCRELERCCGREDVRWVGELVGYLMGYGEEYTTDAALQIMRAAHEHGTVVNFHCGNLDVVEDLCREVPDLPFVLAHPGHGKQLILNRLAKVAELPNLHLDISGAGIDRYGILRKGIEVAGAEKLLFGVDYPINNPASYVAGALFEQLSEEDYAAIFSENFLRLVGQHQRQPA